MSFNFRTPFLDQDGLISAQWQKMLGAIFSGSFADNETPSGVVDGLNVTFTLAKTPNPALCLQLFKTGTLQVQGSGYTLNKNVITFAVAPAIASTLKAFYRY